MARNENPPFERGSTYYNGETIDANDLGGTELEGAEWVFEDVNPTTGALRTERPVRCRIVRNTSTIALAAKRLARFEAGALEYGSRIDGYAYGTADTPGEGYPIDEYLPSSGCPVNDLCWIVIEGPAEVTMCNQDTAESVVAVGGWTVACTAAASTGTTAGRVIAQKLTGATAPLASNIQNRIGRALSAASTANTGANMVIDVGKW